mmetsp:Transcript_5662/g.6142  ORF Transcript_5662/g.6142 Transcript_5662/m.6142 type:complete len:113 (-) Transcript_5662:56-394(-)
MPSRKTKKAQESINSRLALVIKSGKYTLGNKQATKNLKAGQAKLIVIANNTPALRKSEMEYLAMLSKCYVHHYNGGNIDLGTACGRYFPVSVFCVLEEGDSDILRVMQSQTS